MTDRSAATTAPKLGLAQWSALLPMAISLAALATFVAVLLIARPVREPDEGTAAHLWQLLMAAQLPLAAYFGLLWLPAAPKAAAVVFGLQAVVIVANLALVHALNL